MDFTKLAGTVHSNLEPYKIFGTLTNLTKFTEIVQKMASHWMQVYKSEVSATRITQLMEFAKNLIKSSLFKTQIHDHLGKLSHTLNIPRIRKLKST